MLESFYKDIIVHILSYLTDDEKLIFMSVNKSMNSYKFIVKYDRVYDYEEIKGLSFLSKNKRLYSFRHN